MKLTMGQAAKQVNCSKATLSRAIKEGRLSAEKREDGSYAIDPSELQRYADAAEHRLLRETVSEPSKTGLMMRSTIPVATGETPDETGGLQVELAVLRERLKVLEAERERERRQVEEQIEDLRRQRDQANEERREKDRQLTALLADQRRREEQVADTVSLSAKPASGVLARLHFLITGKT